MNRLALSVFASLVATLACVPISHAVEVLHWERLPLSIPLVVGQERVVFVDRNIRVGVPASLGDRLRVQSAGGALYLRASAPLEPTRLQLQDADTGQLILIDVSAHAGKAPLEPVRIVEGESPWTEAHSSSPTTRQPTRETPIAVVLTRYAAQSLYAPLRTVEPVSGISRVSLPGDEALDTLLPTLPVRASALAAWRLEDQWVTAIQLTNTCPRWLELDPRALQGNFVAATFQHPNLGPGGEPSDTTVVYLVTRGHGLAESLLPKIDSVSASTQPPPAAADGHSGKSPKNEKSEDAGDAK